MNGMTTYIIHGTVVWWQCAVCRGNGWLVTPSAMQPCWRCHGASMHKPAA